MAGSISRHSDALQPRTRSSLGGGRALACYTFAWVALMAIAVMMLAINVRQSLAASRYAWSNYGLDVDNSSGRVFSVTSTEASTLGIKAGDTIVAVDGVPMERLGTDMGVRERALTRAEGAAIAMTLQDADGEIRTYRLARSAANVRKNERITLLGIATWIPFSGALLGAATVLFRRRERVPAILALAFVMMFVAPSEEAAAWIDRPWLTGSLHLLYRLYVPLLLMGLLTFPDGRMESRAARAIAAVIVLWTVVFHLFAPNGPPSALSVLAIIALLVVIVARQWLRYRRTPPGVRRQQVRWAIFGFVTGGLCLLVTGAVYLLEQRFGIGRAWESQFASYIVSMIGFLCMAGGLLVSLMRYRLYDAETMISRSAAYGALTVALLAVFAGTERFIELLGEAYFGHDLGAFAGGLGAAAAAAMISPLHHRVGDWAERRFQKDLRRLRKGLPPLLADLRETADLEQLAAAMLDAVLRDVRARHGALLLDGEIVATRRISLEDANDWRAAWTPPAGGALDCDRRDPVLPVRVPLDAAGHGRLGWLLLGSRPDGSLFGKDERDALTEIADPATRSLAVVMARESREARKESRLAAFDDRLHRLESRMAGMIADR